MLRIISFAALVASVLAVDSLHSRKAAILEVIKKDKDADEQDDDAADKKKEQTKKTVEDTDAKIDSKQQEVKKAGQEAKELAEDAEDAAKTADEVLFQDFNFFTRGTLLVFKHFSTRSKSDAWNSV